MRHGASGYPVIGESDLMSGELIGAIKTAFTMLPDSEVIRTVRSLRDMNEAYGILCDEPDDRRKGEA